MQTEAKKSVYGIHIGRSYIINYTGTKRVVLAIENRGGGNVLCWDFTRDGYRTFHIPYMWGITDISDKVRFYDNENKVFPTNIKTFKHDGGVYAANLG